MGIISWLSWYDTTRTLRLKSAKLGLLWWALAAFIILYGITSIFLAQGYAKLEPLTTLIDVIVKTDKHNVPTCEGQRDCTVLLSARDAVRLLDRSSVAVSLSEKVNGTKRIIQAAPVFKLVHSVHTQDFIRSDGEGFHMNGWCNNYNNSKKGLTHQRRQVNGGSIART
jgi:hypothetical protein